MFTKCGRYLRTDAGTAGTESDFDELSGTYIDTCACFDQYFGFSRPWIYGVWIVRPQYAVILTATISRSHTWINWTRCTHVDIMKMYTRGYRIIHYHYQSFFFPRNFYLGQFGLGGRFVELILMLHGHEFSSLLCELPGTNASHLMWYSTSSYFACLLNIQWFTRKNDMLLSDTWNIWFFCILMKILTWKTYGHFDVLLNWSIFRPFLFPSTNLEQGTKMRIWWSLMSHLQVPGGVHHIHWSANLLLA